MIAAVNRLDFHSLCAASKPKLTQKHKEARLLWTQERVNWTNDQWNNVVWSDESRFALHGIVSMGVEEFFVSIGKDTKKNTATKQ